MKVDILELRKAINTYDEVRYEGESKKDLIKALENLIEKCKSLEDSANRVLKSLK